jgi:uncharacterized C2H2 Zn-finger protein
LYRRGKNMGYTGPGGEDYLYPGSRGILSTEHWILDPSIRKVVRLGKDAFLEAVERAQPEVIYRIEQTHFMYYDKFLVCTNEGPDDDFKQTIEVVDKAGVTTEPAIVPMKGEAKHTLDDVGAIAFLEQLAEDLDKPPIPKVNIDDVGILDRCPRCGAVWKDADQCRVCGLSLHDFIDISRHYWCLIHARRIFNYEVRLRRTPDGKVIPTCPYCNTNLQTQSPKTEAIRWMKYPLIVFMVVFLLWLVGRLLGRDILLWG